MAEPRPFRLPISYGHTDAVKDSGGYLINLEAEAAPVDARTDLYALGVCFYEIVCGRRPFMAASDILLMDA